MLRCKRCGEVHFTELPDGGSDAGGNHGVHTLTVLARRWRRYRAMSREDRRLFWSAVFHLARVRRQLARLPLADVLAQHGMVRAPSAALPDADPQAILAARAAVARAARALPFRTTCLVRALVEMRIVGRAQAAAELCIGFQRGADGRLAGHAWVAESGRPSPFGAYAVAARYRAQRADRDR